MCLFPSVMYSLFSSILQYVYNLKINKDHLAQMRGVQIAHAFGLIMCTFNSKEQLSFQKAHFQNDHVIHCPRRIFLRDKGVTGNDYSGIIGINKDCLGIQLFYPVVLDSDTTLIHSLTRILLGCMFTCEHSGAQMLASMPFLKMFADYSNFGIFVMVTYFCILQMSRPCLYLLFCLFIKLAVDISENGSYADIICMYCI